MKVDKEEDLSKKCKVVEHIRHLLKDDDEARSFPCRKGMKWRRKLELWLSSIFLLLTITEAKPVIGSSEAVPFLISLLRDETDPQCKLDALHTLFNLSSHPSNISPLLSAGIINGLLSLVTDSSDHTWTEKSVAVFINLASNKSARDEMISAPGLTSGLAMILDIGEPVDQEHAAACVLILCNGSDKCSQMVLQEGIIPSLVSVSVNGTMRGKQKTQKLLMLFREQRQRDPSPVRTCQDPKRSDVDDVDSDSKPLSKSISTRKVGRAWSFWWKNKSFSVY
ncbi:ARM repeat superfamily protein [Actinidia rufa]|uniref:ARM repeat superfamily protein n=1 Tax=Actinidia rufa TaxID=165716 RepID=A0A7J0FWV8_9ERIC|nr:ARM repeat superfamily protein [Actinidia rufa]